MPCGRNSLFLLVILAVWSCDSEPEPVDILTDYEVALTGGKSLRYYYHRMPENDTTWTDYRTLYENEEKYVTEESFAKGLPQSRYKYKVLGTRQEVVEKIFYHLRDSLTNEVEAVRAHIIQHEPKQRNAEYSGFSFVDYYELSMGLGFKLKTECNFNGRELYLYGGQEIESVRLDHEFRMVTYFKWLPFYFYESALTGHVIFSKGVGMTLYEATDLDGKHYSQKLISVEEI